MLLNIRSSLRQTAGRFAPLFILGLFCLAVFSVYRQFGHVHPADIRQAFGAIETRQLALALLLTIASYCVLVGYDLMALRYIGKRLPFGLVVTTSFLSFAVGNTVGLAIFSGSAIRYRMYNRHGLDAADIAVIGVFCALSFGLGEVVSALSAVAAAPTTFAAVMPQHPQVLRFAALGSLAAMFALAAGLAVRGNVIPLAGINVRMPALRMLLAQMLLAIADLALASAVLYVLLPQAGHPEFAVFLGWFVIAVGAGVLSHVPGGAGVFEAVLAIGLAGTVPVSSLATALLLYRVIYYLIPFLAAVAVIVVTSSRDMTVTTARPLWSNLHSATAMTLGPVVPYVFSWLVLLAGSLMILTSLLPAHLLGGDELAAGLPLYALEATALANGAMGVALVVLSTALSKRVRAAWFITVFLLVCGALLAWLVPGNAILFAAFALATLLAFLGRDRFDRESPLSRGALTTRWFAMVGAVVAAALFILFVTYKETPYSNELWFQFAFDAHAPRALRAAMAAATLLLSGTLFFLLRPVSQDIVVERPDSGELAAIISRSNNANAGLVFTGDKQILSSTDRRSFLMFASHGRSLVAFDDPVMSDDEPGDLVDAFVTLAERSNRRPFFYEVSPLTLPAILDTGMRCYKIGEEAIVDLAEFSLSGKERHGLRSTHNRAVRDGLSFAVVRPPHTRALLDQLAAISSDWLSGKKGAEKGFSIGRFSPEYLDHFPLALACMGDTPLAFANIMVANSEAPATLDLMRHSGAAPAGVMDFMFVEIMLALKADGHQAFSLGIAPLSGIDTMRRKGLWERSAVLAFRHGNQFYGFRGLRAFKDKFHPEWIPRYAAAFSAVDFAAGLIDAAALINKAPGREPGA